MSFAWKEVSDNVFELIYDFYRLKAFLWLEMMEGEMNIRIGFLQIHPGTDIEENLALGKKACAEAKEKGADIALFPEMWSDGYRLPQDKAELKKLAISKNSFFLEEFRALAAELQMAIGITFLEANDPKPLNSVIIFDKDGKEILHYSKVHTCAFDLEKVLSGGDDYYTAELDFGRGTVKIGSMICFDREFPESARILMIKGAELILAPNACPMEINRLSAIRTRAYENMVAVATCNYPEGHPDCNGHSTLFDGVPWNEDGVRDMCVFEASGESGVYVAELDLDSLRAHRRNDIMGDKYRRPDKYGILVDVGSKNEKVNMILCGEVVEKDDADAEKVGVVSVVYVSSDELKIKEKLVELQKSNPDKFYMEYTTPFDANLTEFEHYPSIEVSKEDLQ